MLEYHALLISLTVYFMRGCSTMRWIAVALVVAICAVQIQSVYSKAKEDKERARKVKELERIADRTLLSFKADKTRDNIKTLRDTILSNKQLTTNAAILATLDQQLTNLKAAEKIRDDLEKTRLCLFTATCRAQPSTCNRALEVAVMYGLTGIKEEEFKAYCESKKGETQQTMQQQQASSR